MKIGQVALGFGADDMGSVMIEENVVSAAGTTYRAIDRGVRPPRSGRSARRRCSATRCTATSRSGTSFLVVRRRRTSRVTDASTDAPAAVPLLAGLEPGELERLAGVFRELEFPFGATITHEGERGARDRVLRDP